MTERPSPKLTSDPAPPRPQSKLQPPDLHPGFIKGADLSSPHAERIEEMNYGPIIVELEHCLVELKMVSTLDPKLDKEEVTKRAYRILDKALAFLTVFQERKKREIKKAEKRLPEKKPLFGTLFDKQYERLVENLTSLQDAQRTTQEHLTELQDVAETLDELIWARLIEENKDDFGTLETSKNKAQNWIPYIDAELQNLKNAIYIKGDAAYDDVDKYYARLIANDRLESIHMTAINDLLRKFHMEPIDIPKGQTYPFSVVLNKVKEFRFKKVKESNAAENEQKQYFEAYKKKMLTEV